MILASRAPGTLTRTLAAAALLWAPFAAPAATHTSATAVQEPAATHAAAPSAARLIQQLRMGGYVLVMRHAQAPDATPGAREADPDNRGRERQLSSAGERSARELGQAVRMLGVPIGPIYSSPTFRALQTIHLAQLGAAQVVRQLAEGPQGMSGAAARSQIAWLREAVEQSPPTGRNTLIVTHAPNIVGCFGARVADIGAAEMLVFQPGFDRPQLVGRLTVDDWLRLASRH